MRNRILGVMAVALLAAAGTPTPATAQDDNCISDEIEGRDTSYQTGVFSNRCSRIVQVDLCLKVSDRTAVEYFSWQIEPQGKARLGIALNPGTSYRYVYNWCWGTGCPNSQPDCNAASSPPPSDQPPADRGEPPQPPNQPPGPRRL